MAEITLTDIHKSYRPPDRGGSVFHALRGVSLSIRQGERFALLGPSGCGKSTLLRVISGLERLDSGRVEIGGRDLTHAPPEKRPTAMVFQNYALFPHLNVEGNVAFGLKVRRASADQIRRTVGETLEKLGLAGLEKRRVSDLSGGQQQRVALARALAVGPSALLLDEPLSNLDAGLRRSTRAVIHRVQADLGLTLIYVTHDQEEAMMISDRMAVMSAGSVLQVGTPGELFDCPASEAVARFIGQRNMIKAIALGAEGDGLAVSEGEGNGVLIVRPSVRPESIPDHASVWLALRPDEIEIQKSVSSDGRPGWPAVVELVSFAGVQIEIEIRLNQSGQPLRATLPRARAAELGLKGGDTIDVMIPSGAGCVFPLLG